MMSTILLFVKLSICLPKFIGSGLMAENIDKIRDKFILY